MVVFVVIVMQMKTIKITKKKKEEKQKRNKAGKTRWSTCLSCISIQLNMLCSLKRGLLFYKTVKRKVKERIVATRINCNVINKN